MNLEKLREYLHKFLLKAFDIICIIFWVIIALIIIIILSPLGDYEFKTYTEPYEYSEALSHACQEVGHFPKEIPPWAKNVLLYKPNDCWFGSENFSLSFEIDRGYIDYELNRYKFIETEGPYLTDEEYSDNTRRNYAVKQVNLKKAGFKFYVIDIKKNWNEYGIAVNDKTNRILYYSILLD